MSAIAGIPEVHAKKPRKQAAASKTIAVMITPENAELMKDYERCRGLIGVQEVSQKALVAATKAADAIYSETFSKDTRFQEYLSKRKGQ
jgi:hypothetical protein